MNQQKIFQRAKELERDMTRFLLEMISIPSESAQEKEVILCIRKEMEAVGFDDVTIDPMGNLLGRIGTGPKVIAMDAHVDTVGAGSLKEWSFDPFQGKLDKGVIYGRGASDQKAGMASMVYAGKIIKELGLARDYTLYIVGSVLEEDCDGLCWQYLIKEGGLRPDCVVLTEPTNLNLYRGHRGRMEIGVSSFGVSCHGSAPERGDNAVYKMAKLVQGIEKLNTRLKDDPFLGKGTVTVSFINCKTPSLCAVPNEAYIHLDRRLTQGENQETALSEVRTMIRELGFGPNDFSVEVLKYDRPSYTGLTYPTDKYYPTWVLPEEHPVVQSGKDAFRDLFGQDPKVDKWTFSTNGVATMGMFQVPTIGFGPANEIHAHSTQDQVPVEHLSRAAAFYSWFPTRFVLSTHN